MSEYKNTSMEEVKKEFENLRQNFNPSDLQNINPNEFKSFINGLYQAEGVTSHFFRNEDNWWFKTHFSIGQNYTIESAKVFLLLQHIFEGAGNFKIELTSTGNKHIKYVISDRQFILTKVIPYLSEIYGQKRFDLNKFEKILKINEDLSNKYDPYLVYELVNLIYSTNPDGNVRKLTLNEKLNKLNIMTNDVSLFSKFDFSTYQKENNSLPNIFFIIGLFLGDGSIYCSIEKLQTTTRINPRITIDLAILKNHDWSVNLLKLIATRLDLPKNYLIHKNNKIVILKYRDSKSLEKILNLFLENNNYLFWKKSDIYIIYKIFTLKKDKVYVRDKKGLTEIINLIYDLPNNYKNSKIYWLDLINKFYDNKI